MWGDPPQASIYNSGIIITTGIISVLVIHSFTDFLSFKVALLLIIIIILMFIEDIQNIL